MDKINPRKTSKSPRRAVAAATPPEVKAPDPTLRLGPSLQIKDVDHVHRQLMATWEHGSAVILDITELSAVDTAGVQLLLAFQAEAIVRGVTVDYRGESAPLAHALVVLGIRDKLPVSASHD